MTSAKPWYLSRTIWASLITIISAVASLTGLPVDAIDNTALTDALLQAVTAVSGIIAILGRIGARDRIG